MKSYTITVNGTAYEVTVEENGNAAAAPVAAAPKAAPAPKGCTGSSLKQRHQQQAQVLLKFPLPFLEKLLKIVASVGQSVKAGDSVVIVESMKMEIPVVAPQDGTIASIDVAEGAAVENGDTLATMN